MTESIHITNFADTLFFSRIDHDTFCDYRLKGHGLMWVRSGRMEIGSPRGTVTAGAGQVIFWQRDCTSTMRKLSDGARPSDVYLQVGFKNKSHFFKTFKERFGCTPVHYKENNKKEITYSISKTLAIQVTNAKR